jgi:hypothetical protein
MESRTGVETAGGVAKPAGQGSIQIRFHDNDGKFYVKVIDDVLYFPDSPVNILGVPLLGKQWNDLEGVCISTKSQYSVFTWDNGRCTRNVMHKASGLPELPINEGDSLFSAFFVSFYSLFPMPRATKSCLLSRAARFEDKSAPSSTATARCFRSSFRVGERVTLVNPGSTESATVSDAEFDTNMQQQVHVQLPDGTVKKASGEQLRRASEPDIGVIPRTTDQLAADVDRMSKDALEHVLCPKVLSKDEEEFMQWHH